MIVRVIVVLACVAGVIVALGERRDVDRCDEARREVFAVAAGKVPRAGETQAIERIREHCRGTGAILAVAGALRSQGRERQALVLAREAVDAEPDNALAWRAVLVLASGDEASEAESRLRELDPRSLNRSSGRSTR